MGARTPSIPMANPFQGSFEVETGNVLQYLAVRRGTLDERIRPLALAASIAGSGLEIEGIAQYDALVGEWVAVRYFGVTWAWCWGTGNIVRDDPLEAVSTVAAGATNGTMRPIAAGTVIAAGGMIAGIALENATALSLFKMFLTRQVQVDLS